MIDPQNVGATERFCWCGGALENIEHPLYGKCRDCGTLVLRRTFTENELKSFYGYQQYWHDHQSNVTGHPTIEQRAENDFHDRIPLWYRVLAAHHSSPRRVLEIGCAHGGFLQYCRQQGSKVVVGVEVDEATCKFARDHFGLPHIVSGLFPAVKLPLDQFDVICGFDVVEHFLDPVEALRGVAKILAPSGICFFQTPCHRGEGGDWKQFRPQEHIFLYTEASVRRLFEKCGLEVTEIIPGCFPDDMFIVGRLKAEVTKSVPVDLTNLSRRVKVAADYADKLDLTQIDSQSDFAIAIRQLFSEHRPRKIVETGTYLGEGTTRVIARTLRELGIKDGQFHSIEINPAHVAIAHQNLSREGLTSMVQLHLGVSVPRQLLPSLEEIERATVREIEENDIFVDHHEHERAALYFKETNFHGLPDDLLGRVLRDFNGCPDFVLLDSGGHMGNVEFNYLINQLKGCCWIALDDVHHIKHRRSLRQMQSDDRFEIIVNSTEKFGFCIAKFQPSATATTFAAAPNRCWCGGFLVPSVHELYGCCEKCGTQVLRQHITPAELKEFYTFNHYWHDHQTKDLSCPPIEQRASDDLKDRIPVWHKLLTQLKPDVKTLLEIGCAHGGFLHYCRERGVLNVVGVEVDESTCDYARTRFGLSNIHSGLFPAVKLPVENFDAITGFDVLEHLADPVGALKEVGRLLADDGVFLFQLPCYRGEGRDWRMFCPMNHLFLYNEQSLRQLFALSGLEMDQILPGHFPEDVFVLGRKQSDVRRVLWVRLDSIGDAVLASSMLPWIRKKYPKASISVLCQQHVADLYLAAPMIDRVICLERKECEDDAYLKQIISEIAEFNPQIILNSTRSRDFLSELLTLAFQDARHIGIESDADNLTEVERAEAASRYSQIVPSPGRSKPELERHRDFLKGLDIESPQLQPVVWTAPEDEALADAFFQNQQLDPANTVALFPGAQHEIRLYPGYAAALAEFSNFHFLIFGDNSQLQLTAELASALGDRAINLCGRASLRETAAILRRCRLYVGAESAGAHIACAVGVPNVVILGGGHFGRFMPYSPLTSAVALPLDCYDCNWRCPYSRAHCVKDISANVLAEAIRQTLAQSSPQPRIFIQSSPDWQGGANRPAWKHPGTFLNGADVKIVEVGSNVESNELTPEAQKQVSRAQAALDRGDIPAALVSLEDARKLCPHCVDVLIAVGNLHFQLGNLPACFEALQSASKLRRNDPLVHVLFATVAYRSGQAGEFEAAVTRALELNPSFVPAHRLLADLNLEAGQFVDAAREYGFVIQQNPDDIPALLALGKCFSESKQDNAAEACFERVLELDPINDLARQNRDVLRNRRQVPPAPPSDSVANDSGLETISCPFCQSRIAERIRESADIVRCGDCQTVYLRTRPRKEVMEHIYQTYADDGSHMALPKSFAEADGSGLKRDYFLKEILKFTKNEGRLLDVGCGWGAFLLNARQHGFEVMGHEITRKAAGYSNGTLRIPVTTSQFLETDHAPESQSIVTMLHVFEHLPYPKQALGKVFQVLKPGGIFCGIVPNFDSFCSHTLGEKWFWLDPNYHYVHYTPSTLRKHLETAGFLIERVYTTAGDYGVETVKNLIASSSAVGLAPNQLDEHLQQIEAEGRGEEIRFFARKPVARSTAASVEIFGGESVTNPSVSVVVSTFNSENFLRNCLENLTRQTIFPQLEIIVVDSGSEQNERAIALEFVQKYSNIRYVRTPRETLYAAWNRGLEIARGRYWANLNTDDGLRYDALEIMVAALDQHSDCALAYADCAWTTRPNDTFPSKQIVKIVKYPDYTPIETLFYCVTGCLQFWRTDSIRKLGGFESSLRCAGDYEATLKMMAARLNAVHVSEVLSLFYQNTSGLTQASNRAAVEHDEMMNRYRAKLDIRNIFLTENFPRSVADSFAALALWASKFSVPWEDQPFEHLDFTFACFHRALELDGENLAAGMNLVALNARLNRLDSSEPELLQRWPKMREWIARFRSGEQPPLLQAKPALIGPVFLQSKMLKADSGLDFALEPEAIRPWVSRREGKFTYLSEKLIPRPSGKKYTTKELEALGIQIFKVLVTFPPFQSHFGGAGDALLLLSSYYDQHPQRIVLSYPNSISATRVFFEAFPGMGQVYFFPQSDDPRIHTILRWIMHSLPNCLGVGATPKEGYDEWKAGIDLQKSYGVIQSPRWAAAFRRNSNPRQITFAPQGSLQGMVGSKRNIIDPVIWPELLRFVQTSGFTPCIIGTPDERKNYPCPEGCEDRRSYSFREQMEHIADSGMLIAADSWAKTFSALAGIPTIVFDSLKGPDWNGKKDASDFIFLDPWETITVVKNLDQCRSVFARLTKQSPPQTGRQSGKTSVSWQGSFLDHGSLSHVNRQLTGALQAVPDLQIECVTNGAEGSQDFKSLASKISSAPALDSRITVRHAWPPDWSRPKNGKLVVIQPWEFGALPKQWMEQSKQVDEFWVPSHYVRNVYVDSGVEAEKVFVVPNGIDPEKFHPQATPMNLATRKKFKFLFVGGTIFRKGPDVLLKAYLETFTASDDVCLVIKDFGGQNVYAGQTFESQIRAAQANPTAPEILYLNEEFSPESLPGLYAACDCFVLPYRGEGFGLPVLEAMACGLPVIVTFGGATDDFVRDDFAFRISAQRLIFGNEISGMKLVKPGWLLEPNLAELAEKMRRVFQHPSEAKDRGHRAGEFARQNFTWKNSAEIVANRLRELADAADPSTSWRASKNAHSPASNVAKPKKTTPLVLPVCAKLGQLAEARALLKKKQYRVAWENALAAIALRPFHPEAFLLLGEIALASGDSISARRCAQHARDLAPDWKPAKKFLQGNLRGNARHDWMQLPKQIENPKAELRLTVCLITKNEEQFIAPCLKSIRDIAQQIVVLDTGSTDRTVEIAKENGAEVFNFKWIDDFSAARNAAMEHVTGDWVLVLDADEELLPEHRTTILKEMQVAMVMAYRLPIIDQGKENEGCSYVPRLFRNAPGLFFIGRIHEQIFSSIEVRCEEWGVKNQLGKSTLLHHGYTKEVVASRDKVARNLKLLRSAVEELPDEPGLLMNLGLELIRSKEMEAGLQRYREALAILAQKPSKLVVPELRETLLTQLSTHLMAAKRFDEIAQLWQTPFAKLSMTASQHFLLGLAQMELNRPAEAVEQMRRCLEKRHLPTLSPIHSEILKAGPNHCLALSLVSLQQNEEAEKAFRIALKDDPQSRSARFDFARFQVERGQPLEALQGLHELIAENPDELRVWQFGGQIALSQMDFLEFARDWTSEAIQHFPDDSVINAQRGEVLLLSGDTNSALPFWRKLQTSHSSRSLAALMLCELLAGKKLQTVSTADETLISREFLNWYRKLISAKASSVVAALNQRMNLLRNTLPTFVNLWESAVKEAEQSPD